MLHEFSFSLTSIDFGAIARLLLGLRWFTFALESELKDQVDQPNGSNELQVHPTFLSVVLN